MDTIDSADGTTIAYEAYGFEPAAGADEGTATPPDQPDPLVLAHGSTADHTAWLPHLPHLEPAGPLAAMDRRGRGESGDAEEHSLEREVEDVEALLDATDSSRLFGHSFGGLCALNVAARDVVDLDQLVLFEPAILVGEHRSRDAAARMAELIDSGDREAAMRLALRESAGEANPEAMPHWPEVIERAAVTQREFAAVEAYELPESPAVDVETLVLTAEHSPDFLREAACTVHERLPNSQLVEIEGVGHTGAEAPQRAMAPVVEFLQATAEPAPGAAN